MLIVFVTLLAALGAATVFRGYEVRGLLVLLVANATVALGAAASTRWGWLAFSTAMTGLCLVGIAMVRNEPTPAEPDEERDPDYCFTHKELEPKEER
jgi:hypothetical protein